MLVDNHCYESNNNESFGLKESSLETPMGSYDPEYS